MTKNPEDRRGQLRTVAERPGGRLIDLSYCLGEYDGVVISEFPDETGITTLMLAVIGAGHLKLSKTTTLLTVEQTMDAMRRAGSLTYRAPRA